MLMVFTKLRLHRTKSIECDVVVFEGSMCLDPKVSEIGPVDHRIEVHLVLTCRGHMFGAAKRHESIGACRGD